MPDRGPIKPSSSEDEFFAKEDAEKAKRGGHVDGADSEQVNSIIASVTEDIVKAIE